MDTYFILFGLWKWYWFDFKSGYVRKSMPQLNLLPFSDAITKPNQTKYVHNMNSANSKSTTQVTL